MSLIDLSIIIVTYNSADFIVECLSSVLSSSGVSLEVFVVDNASSDGGVRLVKEKFPGVRLIVNSENLGFGAANNRAMPFCAGRYTVLLNPDTTVEPDSFLKMARFMDSHPEVGIAGPRVENPDSTRQDSVSYRYPGHRFGEGDLGKLPGTIACVLGACQIARSELLRSIKGFDEDFFLYGEDQDICLRARRAGFEVGFIEDAVIMHHGGHSERKTLPAEVVRKKLRAEYLFYRKHYREETIRRIQASQRRKALWRISSIKALMPFTADKEKARRNLERYRVMYEEAGRPAGAGLASSTGKHCPACGGTDRTPLFSKGEWSVFRCAGCGLGALDPRPGPDEVAAMYRDAYFVKRYDEGLEPGTAAMRKRLSGEAHRIRFFRPYRKKGRVLDIGCGRGYFLLACREKGYEVQGFDVSEEGAASVRSRLGIPVETGRLDKAFGSASFDVVTMWHSLEHMADPVSALMAAKRLLKPGGVLVVDVPDYTGTDARNKWESWENWDLPFHFYHFTPASLDAILSRHGFIVARRKRYHSDVIKTRLRKVPGLGLLARPIAKLFSGSSYAVVATRKEDAPGR